MCGFCGKLHLRGGAPVSKTLLARMNASMGHRGPDGEGVFARGSVGLAHRRLSIIDLETGAQPLSNEDGTVWVAFNGEIYNYRELRAELEAKGHRLATASDTEVLVHLWEEHGPDMLERLTGMFAFALWDERQRTLMLARDRVGIKPLYWARRGDALLFGSELKALLVDPALEPRLEPRAVDRFLRHDYLPGEATLVAGVEKLAPGHRMLVELAEGDAAPRLRIERWWDLVFPPADAPTEAAPFPESVRQLEDLLGRVVADHLVADVPVGFLLSGGLDSTALLSLAAERASAAISTFTVGFADPGLPDERRWAALAAERFGTDHHEITVPPGAFADFLPRYVWHMEEPVCEPPAIALFYVAQLAARHVKVVLSGEGGDEAFAGYGSFGRALALERAKRALGPLRAPAALALRGMGRLGLARRWESWARRLPLDLEQHYLSRTSHPFRWYASHAASLLSPELARQIDAEWSTRPSRERFERVRSATTLSQLLYVDSGTWLPDDLLVKADKMTMACSLELRVPLLDHRVLERAASLPDDYKLAGAQTKRILRALCAERVPRAILERPKAGFPVPYGRWLREDLSGFVRDLLLERRARERGLFQPRAVESMLDEHARGRDRAKEIFCLVVLELWQRAFLDGAPVAAPAPGVAVA